MRYVPLESLVRSKEVVDEVVSMTSITFPVRSRRVSVELLPFIRPLTAIVVFAGFGSKLIGLMICSIWPPEPTTIL